LPIPTRIFASEEYEPAPQSIAQRQVEQRLQALGASQRASSESAAGGFPDPAAWPRRIW
jgi:hypothetical protein